ncbi:hypothetical protein [Parasphingorhabdus marina]|nr:hypothetical protein [Parasphingorhabdus marina]
MEKSHKLLKYKDKLKLARPVQCMGQLRKQNREDPVLEKERKMISNMSHNVAAAFAALVSSAVLLSASIGPAVDNAANLIA